jgi:hypothetical protein
LTNHLLEDQTSPLRTLLACLAGLAATVATAAVIGTYRVGELAVMIPALYGGSAGVLGVFVATARERRRRRAADIKKSPTDLRSR